MRVDSVHAIRYPLDMFFPSHVDRVLLRTPAAVAFADRQACKFTDALSRAELPGTTQTPDTPHIPPTCLSRYLMPRTLGCSSRATRSENLLPNDQSMCSANHPTTATTLKMAPSFVTSMPAERLPRLFRPPLVPSGATRSSSTTSRR